MKGIFLAAIALCLAFICSVAVLRLMWSKRRVWALTWIFTVCAGSLAVASLMTSDDLLFLPKDLLAGPRWLDVLMSLFFFTAGFFGGLLQLYNLADRGFSLRVMIDILEQADRATTAASLFDGYSRGNGMGWMYQKRLDDLVRNHLVFVEGDTLVATAQGRRTAAVFTWMRELYGFELPKVVR